MAIPDRDQDFAILIRDYLNDRLRVVRTQEVGINGGEWNVAAAIRQRYPSMVPVIFDSIVVVRYGDTTARFELDTVVGGGLCALHYRGDTMICGSPANPHPLVAQLNALLNDIWGYRIPAAVSGTSDVFNGDSTYILRVYADQPQSLVDIVNAALANQFSCINGTTDVHPLSTYLAQNSATSLAIGATTGSTMFWLGQFSIISIINSDQILMSPASSGIPLSWLRVRNRVIVGDYDSTFIVVAPANKASVPAISGKEHEMGVSYTQLAALAAQPYTSIIGYFSEDSAGYLIYHQRKWGTDSTEAPMRIFGVRFFSRIDQTISDSVCIIHHCEAACFRWIDRPVDSTVVDTILPLQCHETVKQRITQGVNASITSCIDQYLRDVANHYRAVCAMPDSLDDRLILSYPIDYYHFTLFYYDRAGNLVKMVNPNGVDLSATSRMDHPSHVYINEFDYNSLGQPVRTRTPDGDTTEVLYDQWNRPR
ncbi:MAG: hypothetical protein ABI876_18060, partial [Bacteroidota bacterium]